MVKTIYLNHDQIEPLEEKKIINGSLEENISNISEIISSMKIKLNNTRILIEELDRIFIKDKL